MEEFAAATQKGCPIGRPFYYDHGIDREWIRIGGYLFSVSERGEKLFYVLMLGQNRSGKTLLDCDPGTGSQHGRISHVFSLSRTSLEHVITSACTSWGSNLRAQRLIPLSEPCFAKPCTATAVSSMALTALVALGITPEKTSELANASCNRLQLIGREMEEEHEGRSKRNKRFAAGMEAH